MKILHYYWAPSLYEISGHSAMAIIQENGSQEFIGFWAISPDRSDGLTCASYLNQSFNTDCRVIGLRKMIYHDFIKPINLPVGIGIYLVLINALETAKSIDDIRTRLLNWKNEFASIQVKTISEHDAEQIDSLCGFISNYRKKRDLTQLLQESLEQGQPTEVIEVNGLDTIRMKAKLDDFLQNPHRLLWAAQIGSQTDCDLSDPRYNCVNFFAMLPGSKSIPGIKGYQKAKIRHNCSSLILALLQEGGIDRHLQGYREKPSARLREIMILNEGISDNKKAEQLKKINTIAYLPAFSMARYCGTTPHELNEMCKYAEAQRLKPAETHRRCAIQ
jgi:hypothetical protein